MQILTRDEQIRGYVRGVLVSHSGDNLSPDNIGKIADELVQAIDDAIERWQVENDIQVLIMKEKA
jgi:hypothetical protein